MFFYPHRRFLWQNPPFSKRDQRELCFLMRLFVEIGPQSYFGSCHQPFCWCAFFSCSAIFFNRYAVSRNIPYIIPQPTSSLSTSPWSASAIISSTSLSVRLMLVSQGFTAMAFSCESCQNYLFLFTLSFINFRATDKHSLEINIFLIYTNGYIENILIWKTGAIYTFLDDTSAERQIHPL